MSPNIEVRKIDIRARHEAIIRALRRGGASQVSTLAQSTGTSRRTILRDLAYLRDQGYVIHSESGRGGGIQLDPQSVQIAPRLSVSEIFALLISVTTMRVSGTLPFSVLADSGLAKIEGALPKEKVHDLRRFIECLHVGPPPPPEEMTKLGAIDPSLLSAFEQAFLRLRHLRFDYCDAKGQHSTREVEPQAMLILPPLWYLVAWDPARRDFRHFRMDRISQPNVNEDLGFRRRYVPFENDICPLRETVPFETLGAKAQIS